MDVKSNVRKRREERIRQLTAGDLIAGYNANDSAPTGSQAGGGRVEGQASQPVYTEVREPDPELLWKKGQGRWNDDDLQGPGDAGGFSGGRRASFWTMLFLRIVIASLLFGFVWGINRYQPEWSMPVRLFVAKSLTQEMDFAAVETWYENTFGGAPSFIPIFRHQEEKGLKVGTATGFTVPLSGRIAASFAIDFKGVEIVPTGDSGAREPVKSVETGRVLGVARDASGGMTVTVQHAGGYISVYGHLDNVSVGKGDWLEGGDPVGSLSSEQDATLYFALKMNDRYIDPTDVIPFD